MRKLDKTETLVTLGDMTYVREVTKLTCIVVCVYISSLTKFAYFLSFFKLCFVQITHVHTNTFHGHTLFIQKGFRRKSR